MRRFLLPLIVGAATGLLPLRDSASPSALTSVAQTTAHAVTTVNISDTVRVPSVKRFGVNLGSLTYWDSGQFMKQLLGRNPGFEPQMHQSAVRCISGTATTCTAEYVYWPNGFWDGATFEVIWGAAKGRTGTIASSTVSGRENGLFQFSNSGTAPGVGDYIVLRKTDPGGATAGWFPYPASGVTFNETADLAPDAQGRQAVRITTTADQSFASLSGYIDTRGDRGLTFVQLNGRYRLTFKAKALNGNTVSARVRRLAPANTTFIDQAITLSNSWSTYNVDFSANESGNSVGTIEVQFRLSSVASVLLDEVSLTETSGDRTNVTAFRDAVVRTLKSVNPGLLRYWDDQLGDSLENQIAPYFARKRSAYRNGASTQEKVQIGLYEFLELCEQIGAEPWYVVPITFSLQEMRDLMEYLAGPATTPYGAKRAARGRSAPWTPAFSRIHLEFGNETWNTVFGGGTIGYPTPYGNRGSELFAAAKNSPYYDRSTFDFVLGGQAGFVGRNSQIHAASTNHDSLALAPYIGLKVDRFQSNEDLFGPLFAEAEAVNQTGNMRQNSDMVRTSTRRIPISVYEVNLHTTEGSISQTALDSFTPSLGAGLAVSNHMLMMLRDVGIRDQMMFSLPQYDFRRDDGKNARLWGIVRDMGVTDRRRPQYLALKLANDAIIGDLVETTQSGENPTWNQPLVNGVQYNNAHFIQSYAFRSGNSRSLVIFNLHRSDSLPVNFAGANAPRGDVTLKRLAADSITATNEDSEQVVIASQALDDFDPNQPLSLPPYSMSVFEWRVGVPEQSFTIRDRGGFSATTAGGPGTLRAGYSRIQPDAGSSTPSGVAIFGFQQNNVLISEAAVPASPLIQAGRIYLEVDGSVNTGIAIANPNNQPATVGFYFTDSSGRNFGEGSTTIPANGQIARFLDQAPFNSGSAAQGTFTFNSSVPVSVIALRGLTNERSEFLITTLTVADISAGSSEPIRLPHFADGGGWKTQVVLVNPSDETIRGTVQFYGQGGTDAQAEPVTLAVDGQLSNSFDYEIAPRSSSRLRTSGSMGDIQAGSVRVTPVANNRAPVGLVIFSFRSNGVTVSETGVSNASPASALRLYAEISGTVGRVGSLQTGVAIANASSTPATVNLELTRLDGTSTGLTGRVPLPASGQVALFLSQIAGFASLTTPFQGVLRISTSASSPISVVGLRGRYNERGEFLVSTTPTIDENAPLTTADLFFPHIVNAGGYSTQFILFSGSAGQSSSGILRFYSQSGQSMSLPLR